MTGALSKKLEKKPTPPEISIACAPMMKAAPTERTCPMLRCRSFPLNSSSALRSSHDPSSTFSPGFHDGLTPGALPFLPADAET